MTDIDPNKALTQYARQLRNFFASRVRNRADADDLVQEVFQKTLVHFRNIKEPAKFRSWLFSVARNALTDHYRRTARYVHTDPAPGAEERESPAEVKKELAKCVRPFLTQLPAEYRQALEAVELEGRPQTELAGDLGLTYSGLKSRVQRGRDMLRQLFRQCCRYEFDAQGNVMDFRPGGRRPCGTCAGK